MNVCTPGRFNDTDKLNLKVAMYCTEISVQYLNSSTRVIMNLKVNIMMSVVLLYRTRGRLGTSVLLVGVTTVVRTVVDVVTSRLYYCGKVVMTFRAVGPGRCYCYSTSVSGCMILYMVGGCMGILVGCNEAVVCFL